MSVQLSTTARNARLAAIATAIGASGILKIWTGSLPANCAASDTGTQVASPALPAAPFAAPAGGAMSMAGTWEDSSADAAGTAGYFRIYDGSAVCHLQGTVSATGGGGDMTVDNVVFAAGQDFKVTSFSLTDANA